MGQDSPVESTRTLDAEHQHFFARNAAADLTQFTSDDI